MVKNILFVLVLFTCFFSCNACADYISRIVKPQDFSGRITQKYIDTPGRMACFIVVNQQDTEYVDYANYLKFEIGDSVEKFRGETQYILYKGDEKVTLCAPCAFCDEK